MYEWTPQDIERFWSKVDKSGGDNACWEWKAGKVSQGYGVMWLSSWGGNIRTSRFAYQITYGEIPERLLVLHSCDNPPCCNPDHLFLGTRQDNVDDAVAKGRAHGPRGETSGTHKLSAAQVSEIRKRFSGGKPVQQIVAREFGVSPSTISLIVNRKRWA